MVHKVQEDRIEQDREEHKDQGIQRWEQFTRTKSTCMMQATNVAVGRINGSH